MKLVRYLTSFEAPRQGSVVTIGSFDGLHLGHQQLLNKVISIAQQQSLASVVMTFEPQPYEYFHKKRRPRLMRLREKWLTLSSMQIDLLLCLHFNAAMAVLSAEDFVTEILLKKLNMKCIVIGDDFRFGAKRAGDVSLLQTMAAQYNFTVEQLPTHPLEQERVSSTRVRNALKAGDMQMAEALLGRPYYLAGKVCHGEKLGRQLGFPTANLNVHRNAVPLQGIYVVRVVGLPEGPLYGAANVGTRPTVNGERTLLEVFILDFERDIYAENIEVEFLHKLRDEERYDSLDTLKQKIAEDVQNTKEYIKQLILP
ncbi:MAG: bifunctional riboflavin kinase/FAD synthetase [Gammaproteobacteria bacterium]|nr:bifunctional riboflavin kinase/FAD synthetase [Gammaproteobacteria bacterium]